jgi:hypothetical protein
MFGFVAARELIFLPCPIDASVQLHSILFAIALLRQIVVTSCKSVALLLFVFEVFLADIANRLLLFAEF